MPLLDVAHGQDQRIVLRTMTMPADIDASGNIPTGWLLAKLDQAGSVLPAGHFGKPALLAELAPVQLLNRPGLNAYVTFKACLLRLTDEDAEVLVEVWSEDKAQTTSVRVLQTTARYVPGQTQVPGNLFPGSFGAASTT